MRASYFAQIIAIIGFIVGGLIMQSAGRNHGLFYLGVAMSVGSMVWYFWKGQRLTGWIGDGHDAMKRELAQIDESLSSGKNESGLLLSTKESDRLYRRQMEIWEGLRQHNIERGGE